MQENYIDKFKDYLSKEKNYSAHTIGAYTTDIRSFEEFLGAYFPDETLLSVTFVQVRKWIVYLVEKGLNERSVNRKISSLRAYYRFLIQILAIDKLPFSGYIPLKTQKKVVLPFSFADIGAAVQTDDEADFKDLRDRTIIMLLYATGIRRAELVELQVQSVDFQCKNLKVLGKGNKERLVPLLEEASIQLQVYLEARKGLSPLTDALFITEKGKRISANMVYRIVKSRFAGSDKERKSPHVLRHSFASHLIGAGGNLEAVKNLLGHKSIQTTQIYTHSTLSELRDAYAKHPRLRKED